MKKILVTGGAGYIGSHTVNALLQQGYEPVVIDNLSNGFIKALPKSVLFYEADVRDKTAVHNVFTEHRFSAVIHLAAHAIVEESFNKAEEYVDNNVNSTLALLESCNAHNVKRLIFSSSSTIYGNANKKEKLSEKHNISPISPYGKSKKICEEKIAEYSAQHEINFLNLRYFNVAGASVDVNNGQRGHGSQRVIFAATEASLKDKTLVINGADYDTEDGSCVRDYIHVDDVADIHVKALDFIEKNKSHYALNCGYGDGYSVRQIVDIFKKVNKTDFKVEIGPRRIGDPDYLVGDNSELVKLLCWKSRFTNPIEVICKTAFEWGKKYSLG